MANKHRSKELPEEVISSILSKVEDARYTALASTVSRSWNKSSTLVNTLIFSGSGRRTDWYRMIKKRLDTLESIHLRFVGDDGNDLCLGLLGACHKLSNLSLDYESVRVPVVNILNILSTSNNLASLSLSSICEVRMEGGLGLIRLHALKVLRLLGNIVVESRDFWSAFPALEELEYGNLSEFTLLDIESNTLRSLKVDGDVDDDDDDDHESAVRVKAPKLVNLTVNCVAKVYCESAPAVSCIQVLNAREVICDASHVALLELDGYEHESIRFSKLVSVQTLIYKSDFSESNKLPAAALASVETATLEIRNGSYGSQVHTFFNNLKRVKSLTVTAKIIKGEPPSTVCLPELKRLRYILEEDCEPSFLYFIWKSSPAVNAIEISSSRHEGDETELMEMFHWLFQLQRSKPELVVNVA